SKAMQRGVGLAGRPAAQSRARARVRMIELGREYRGIRRDLLSACERVLDRMQLLGGEELRAFEAEMARFIGTKYAKGVASGTDALRLGARTSGGRQRIEVFVQGYAIWAAGEAM